MTSPYDTADLNPKIDTSELMLAEILQDYKHLRKLIDRLDNMVKFLYKELHLDLPF